MTTRIRTKRLVALVPAFGGGGNCFNTTLRPLAGRPLIYWVLDAACGCPAIDEVYVATNAAEVAAAVRRYSGKVSVMDCGVQADAGETSTESALAALARKVQADHICVAPVASPLVRAEDLQRGVALYCEGRYDAVLAGVRARRPRWRVLPAGDALPEGHDGATTLSDEASRGEFVDAGAFYITSKAALVATGRLLSGRVGIVEVTPESCIDLDEPAGWMVAEQLLLRRRQNPRAWMSRLGNIKVFATDVDGVLTDGGMIYVDGGGEMKKFNAKDGTGILLLKQAGIIPAIITAERTEVVQRRAEKLGIEFVYQGASDKLAAAEDLMRRLGISWAELAYIGDDLIDLPVIRHAGFSAAPADAVEEVRRSVDYVCKAGGGRGCVREVCELLLARGATSCL